MATAEAKAVNVGSVERVTIPIPERDPRHIIAAEYLEHLAAQAEASQ